MMISASPGTLFLVLSVALVVLFRVSAAADCGTCDSLNYQCITATNPLALKDTCGHLLDPALCPVRSCADYCLATTGAASAGRCDDQTHMCDCAAGRPDVTIAPPTPTRDGCMALTCSTLRDALQCIPANTKDACSGQLIPEDACGFSVCPARCPCAPGGTGCDCSGGGGGTATAANVSTELAPVPSSSAPPVKSKNADYPTYTAANGTTFLGGGAIAGITVGAAFTVAALVFVGIAVANVCSGARADSDAGKLVKQAPGFYSKKVPISV